VQTINVAVVKVMQIGEVAAEAGVKTQTIRFYERRGLIREPERTRSGYRAYPASVVDVIRFIKESQELGYTLAEIKQLLALHDKDGNAEQVRALVTAKIEYINNRIDLLIQMRDQLENLAANCHCGDELQPDCPAIKQFDYRSTST
jgi:DNA-binding transcriptional MerR regulator